MNTSSGSQQGAGRKADRTAKPASESEDLFKDEHLLAEVFSCVRDGISVLDTNMVIVRVNTAMEQWYAHAMPIVGKKCYEVYHGRTAPCNVCPTIRTLETGTPEYAVVAKVGPGGKTVGWQDLYSFPLIDSTTKKIKGVIEYVRDITSRKQAEDALRESEQKYRAIFDNSPMTITLLDADGRVLDMNAIGSKIVGYTLEDVAGKHFTELPYLPKETKRRSQEALESRKQGQGEGPYEVEFTTSDGRRLTGHVHSALLKDQDGHHIGTLVMVSDVTRFKELQQQFHQAQKMESIGRLASGIAHDFNNLLSAIMGFSELLLTDLKEDDPRCRDVNEIKKAARRAGALTHQLLAFSRKQTIEFTVVDVNALVENMGRMLKRMIGEDIRLDVKLGKSVSQTRADGGQIEQVIANLVVNARDAMPDGGILTVATANISLRQQEAALVPDARPGDFVSIAVSDTGVGISPEVVEHIFEPFFTTKGKGEGTGLGLATVYGIVKQHRGWVVVSSEIGKGTTFTVYLPAVSGTADDAHVDEDLRKSGHEKVSYRVALVEDDDELRNMMARLLEKKGHRVDAVPSAEAAAKLFEGESGDYDLLIADVVLAGKSGLELAEEMAKKKPKMRILLCSGYSDKKSRYDAIDAKGFRFLQKPFSAPTLLNTVRELMK